MIYLGVDPGLKGAIAAVSANGQLMYYQMFKTWKENHRWLLNTQAQAQFDGQKPFVCIEKLWGMPLRGSMGNFSLGGNVEGWRCLLEIENIPYIEAAPATWQPVILKTKGKKPGDTKIESLKYVNKRYPDLNLPMIKKKDVDQNSGISDAICLALYGMSVQTNLVVS